ncbi:MAG: hypothetical protein AB7U82_27660 [Blastocatellales bacterium]
MSRANQWRGRARSAEAKRAVDLELPSGAVVMFCRPSLLAWIGGGRIPETFMSMLQRVVDAGGSLREKELEAARAISELSEQDQIKYATFLNDLVVASVIEPKIVLGIPQFEDEISIAEIPEDDLMFILKEAMSLAPSVPVQTKGGDVPLAAIEDFRDKPEGGVLTEFVGDVLEVPPVPV